MKTSKKSTYCFRPHFAIDKSMDINMNRNKHISPVCVSPTKFVWHPIALCLMLSIHSAVAEDYFDPAFLQAMGETDQVDLSAYAKKAVLHRVNISFLFI